MRLRRWKMKTGEESCLGGQVDGTGCHGGMGTALRKKRGVVWFFGIPREVRLLDDHSLQFIPVKELESLRRREMISVSEESITEETPFFAGRPDL